MIKCKPKTCEEQGLKGCAECTGGVCEKCQDKLEMVKGKCIDDKPDDKTCEE